MKKHGRKLQRCWTDERMAHDLLSNGIVPACVTVHQASRLQDRNR